MQNQTQTQIDIVADVLSAVREMLGPVDFPEATARAIEIRMRVKWGGHDAYVRKTGADIEARAIAIRTKYNMCNRRELMEEYGIGRAHFYKILKGS